MIKIVLILISHLVITFCAEWTDASWSDYPFMVRLDIEQNGARYICGGSIISTNECGRGVILTAAHCVQGATNINVGVGCTQTSCTDAGAKYYNDNHYVIHPSYDPSLPSFDTNWANNDVALIYLSEPISNTNAAKIDLHSDISVLQNNDDIRVFGYYGDCSRYPNCVGGSDTDSLEYADTHYMITSECDDIWGSHVTGPHDFCTKDDDASNGLQSICAGDSGSPLIFEGKQIGLNSWGHTYCDPDLPGVATSIPHYYQWITSQLNQCNDSITMAELGLSRTSYISNNSSVSFVAGLIMILLMVNIAYLTYINCVKRRGRKNKYQSVEMIDSDTDIEQANPINIVK